MRTLRAFLIALCCLASLALVGPGASAQTPLEQLVSPGKLSRPHEKQEATCNVCHESFNKGAQSTKCLDCHKDINWDVRNKRGFHGRSPAASGVECKTCHTEHEGRDAKIVQIDQKRFDHRFTDMPLTGGHARVDCASCHLPGIKFAKAPTDCIGCHKSDEPHQGRLGTACATCHVVTDWKTIRFDHAPTGFALKGAHAQESCASCHSDEKWKGVATTCDSCHAKDDRHEGKLGPDCASCHNEQAWKVGTFNHARTGFALQGKHATIRCEACHVKSVTAPLPRDCAGCHGKDDVHKGRNGLACADCHVARSWKTVTFDHARTKFPLFGKHAAVNCETCHTRPMKEWKPPLGCNECHKQDDKHKGLLGPMCRDCHSETSWAKVSFEHERDANFALNGKHAKATCAACHTEPTPVKSPPVSCIGCHREDDAHKRQLGDGCGQCHGEKSWKTDVRFDHDLTDFPLLGKHARVTCKECHATPAFLDASTTCVSCHTKEDVHRGRLGADCVSCHNPVDWKRWRFDHDAQTQYPLSGKHREVACEGCHRSEVKGKISLSTRCISCHAADDKHRGGFGTGCERCHSTEAFWAVDVKR
ncbi:MAG: cytochrome c3 family protein [Hyphomonadaceae bacterium]